MINPCHKQEEGSAPSNHTEPPHHLRCLQGPDDWWCQAKAGVIVNWACCSACQYDSLFPAIRFDNELDGQETNEKEFTSYYAGQVQQQLESGKNENIIDVDLWLSTIKPLHAQWLVNVYDFFSTHEGRKITLEGWKKSRIAGLLDKSTALPAEDPFAAVYTQSHCIWNCS